MSQTQTETCGNCRNYRPSTQDAGQGECAWFACMMPWGRADTAAGADASHCTQYKEIEPPTTENK